MDNLTIYEPVTEEDDEQDSHNGVLL